MMSRYFEFLKTLPRTPNGKVRKDILRDQGSKEVTGNTWDSVAGEMLNNVLLFELVDNKVLLISKNAVYYYFSYIIVLN